MSTRRSLVNQFLENVSRDALVRYQKIVRQYAHRRQGVYALYRKGRLYYVGLASNLRGRLRAHIRDQHGSSWDRFSVYLTEGDNHLHELEALVLRIVMPKGNRQGGKFVESENLRKRFERDIRAQMDEETRDIMGEERRRKRVTRPHRSRRKSRTSLFSGIAQRPKRLRADYKGQKLRARVLADGRISFKRGVYASPSKAAFVATGRACNGWWFWKFERAPGEWVRLRELRK